MDKKAIVERYTQDHYSLNKIAAEYHLSVKTIKRILGEQDIAVRDRNALNRKDLQYDTLYSLYIVQGKSMKEISDLLKVSKSTVYNYLVKYSLNASSLVYRLK